MGRKNQNFIFLFHLLISYQCVCLSLAGVFDYEVKITSGDSRYLSHVSQFDLKSELEVFEEHDKDIFQFKDIHISTFKGDVQNETQKWDDLNQENHLYLPFMSEGMHGDNKIRFMKTDEDWAINIKKSIVSLFNIPTITAEYMKQGVFKFNQSDLYEKCENLYIIDDVDQDVIQLTRSVNVLECFPMRNDYHHISNADLLKYNKNATDIKPMVNYRTVKYSLTKMGEKYDIESINAETVVKILMHRNVEVSQYVKVHQILKKKKDVVPSKNFNDFKDEDFGSAVSVGYKLTSVLDLKTKAEEFKASHKYIGDEITVENVLKMLRQVAKWYETVQDPKYHATIAIAGMSELLFYLRHLNSEQLYEIYMKVKAEAVTYNFFKNIMGDISTDSNAAFIMKIFKEDNKLATKLLSHFVVHWKPLQPIKVKEMIDLLSQEPNAFNIRAVSLLLKNADHTLKGVKAEVDLLVNGLKKAKSTEEQTMYLFALYNVCYEGTFNFILSIAKGESDALEFPYNHHLQSYAIMSIGNFLQTGKGKDVMDEMFNIIRNPKNYLTVHISALKVFVAHASEEELILLSKYLVAHRTIYPNLYSYYYDLLKKTVEDVLINQMHANFKQFAKTEFHNFAGRPETKITRILQIGDFDIEVIVDSTNQDMYQVIVSPIAENAAYVLSDAQLIIKFDRKLEGLVFEMMNIGDVGPKDPKITVGNTFEYVYIQNGKILENMVANLTNPREFKAAIEHFSAELKNGFGYNSAFKEISFPIDFGFYVHWEYMEPSFCDFELENIANDRSSSTFMFSYKQWQNYYHKLNVFNPIMKNTFGALQIRSFDLDVSTHINFKTGNRSLKVEIQLVDNKTANLHVENQALTFVTPSEVSYVGTPKTLDYYSNVSFENEFYSMNEFHLPGAILEKHISYSSCEDFMATSWLTQMIENSESLASFSLRKTDPVKYVVGIQLTLGDEFKTTDNNYKMTYHSNTHASVEDLNGTSIIDKEIYDLSLILINNAFEGFSFFGGMENTCLNYTKSYEYDQLKSVAVFKTGNTSKECYDSAEVKATIEMTGKSSERSTTDLKKRFHECTDHNKWSFQKDKKHHLSLDCILAWTNLDLYEYGIEDKDKITGSYIGSIILRMLKKTFQYTIDYDDKDGKPGVSEYIMMEYNPKHDAYWAKRKYGTQKIFYEQESYLSCLQMPDQIPNMGFQWHTHKTFGSLFNFIITPEPVNQKQFKSVSNFIHKEYHEASNEYQTVLRNDTFPHFNCEILTKKNSDNQMYLRINFKPNGYLIISPTDHGDYLTTMDKHFMEYLNNPNPDPTQYFGLRLVDMEGYVVIFMPHLGKIIVYDEHSVQIITADQ